MSGINNEPRETKKKSRTKGRLRQTLEKIPLLRRLLRNPFLKVLSLVFAILLWAMVMSQTNPPRAKVVYDVPVELTGVTDLNARGLSLATEGGELPASVDVRLGLRLRGVEARALEDNVNADFAPRKVLCVLFRVDLQRLAVDRDGVRFVVGLNRVQAFADLAAVTALRGIVLQKMCEHGGLRQIVDRNNLVTLSAKHLSERQTANTAKTIDCNFNSHDS